MQKLLSIAALALIFGLSACNKDDDDNNNSGEFSKADAKAKINTFNASATQDLQDLASSEGLEAVVDLSELAETSDPFGGRLSTDKKKLRTFLRKKGHTFRTIIDKKYAASGRTKGSEPFDFEANKGVYTWNATQQEFVRSADSDIIVIEFPTEGSATNNAELRLLEYEEVEIYDEEFQEYFYEPSILKASLLIDGTEAASLDLDVQWDENGFPLTADLTATVTPFTANVSFDVTASDKNTLSASLLRGTETLFATSVTVLYASSAKTEEDLKTVSGFVQLKELKLEGTIDVEGMDAAQEPDLNDFVHLSLTSENKKIGDIVFVTETVDGFEESVAYIQYADGTKEKLEDALQPVIDELDQISEELNG